MPLPRRCLWPIVSLVLCLAAPATVRSQIQGAGTAPTGQRRLLRPETGASPNAYYVLQPGDTVSVSFRFTPEFNEEVVVGPDGRAAFKAAGDVKAAGLSVPELEREIAREAGSKLVKPEISITLKDFDRPHIFVAGEVNTPGRQDLRHPTTALQAVLASGGPKDDAALGRVLLFRRIDAETAEVHVLDLHHYSRRAREKNDMLLQPDDMILVRHDVPSRIERYVKLVNLGFYINPLQNVAPF